MILTLMFIVMIGWGIIYSIIAGANMSDELINCKNCKLLAERKDLFTKEPFCKVYPNRTVDFNQPHLCSRYEDKNIPF